jgi:phytoene dehydrogenase-like protein
MKKAIVVGSGIAGIASAIRLQNKGYKVQILEKTLIRRKAYPI